MSPGKTDLIILLFLFVSLQAWWIIPSINKNNKMNEKGKELRKEIKQLEKLYRK